MTGPHEYETGDIRGLESAMNQLQGHCSDLQMHAMAASAALGGQWQGIANTEFLNSVQTWQVGASILTAHAEFLATWAGEAASQYEEAQSNMTSQWAG